MQLPINFATLLHIDDAYERELRGLTDAIIDDTAVPMPPQEARAALAIALAAVRSSAEGRVVRLDEM